MKMLSFLIGIRKTYHNSQSEEPFTLKVRDWLTALSQQRFSQVEGFLIGWWAWALSQLRTSKVKERFWLVLENDQQPFNNIFFISAILLVLSYSFYLCS